VSACACELICLGTLLLGGFALSIVHPLDVSPAVTLVLALKEAANSRARPCHVVVVEVVVLVLLVF
jgi:hypothetical protein